MRQLWADNAVLDENGAAVPRVYPPVPLVDVVPTGPAVAGIAAAPDALQGLSLTGWLDPAMAPEVDVFADRPLQKGRVMTARGPRGAPHHGRATVQNPPSTNRHAMPSAPATNAIASDAHRITSERLETTGSRGLVRNPNRVFSDI